MQQPPNFEEMSDIAFRVWLGTEMFHVRSQVDNQEKRIRALEGRQKYLAGGVGVLGFVTGGGGVAMLALRIFGG